MVAIYYRDHSPKLSSIIDILWQSGTILTDSLTIVFILEVKDVVNATLYLLSDKSDMINGVTLPIDGGFLASH